MGLGWVGKKIYLDSNIIIYIVEREPRYYANLAGMLAVAAQGQLQVITSDLSLLECLVLPLRVGNQAIINAYLQMFTQSDLICVPISRDVLTESAALRAQHPALRTPDAIHWATARIQRVDYLITNDQTLLRLAAGFAIPPDQLPPP